MQWLKISRPLLAWHEEIQWVSTNMRGKSSGAEIYKMALAGSVYLICQERNLRRFHGKHRSVETITKMLVQAIFCRIHRVEKLNRSVEALNCYP